MRKLNCGFLGSSTQAHVCEALAAWPDYSVLVLGNRQAKAVWAYLRLVLIERFLAG